MNWVVRTIRLDKPEVMLSDAAKDALDLRAISVYIDPDGTPMLVAMFSGVSEAPYVRYETPVQPDALVEKPVVP